MARWSSGGDFDEEAYEKRSRTVGAASGVIILVATLTMGLMIVNNTSVQPDKVYSPNSYYEGKYQGSVEINPRDAYNQLVSGKVNSVNASSCDSSLKFIDVADDKLWYPDDVSSDIVWPVLGDTSGAYGSDDTIGANYNLDKDGVEIYGSNEAEGYKRWYIYAKSDDSTIVSPWTGAVFINSNIDDPTTIKLMPAGGDGTKWLEFRDISNWFCHMSSSVPGSSHTVRIGKSPDTGQISEIEDLGQGYAIIGKATEYTYLIGMYQPVGQSAIEVSPYYIMNSEEVPR